MSKLRKVLMALCLSVLATVSQAAIDAKSFDTPQKEQLYNQLIADLRCLVCQNQNLADSNAELAVDLRTQVHEMVSRGDSGKQVSDYMVERYGEFVLYRPPINARTMVLWGGPLLALLIALGIAWQITRSRQTAEQGGVSEADVARARDLLNK
ncbi:MAG: cytochrome c-type biogenesis protein [Granulosicoccaceae bacterium]